MDSTRSLVQEYVLAVLDPQRGRPVVPGSQWKAGVAGAVVVQAVFDGTLRLTRDGDPELKPGRLALTRRLDGPEPVAEALRRADGRKPKDAVARIGGAQTVRDRASAIFVAAAAALEARGVLRSEVHKVLRLVPTTRWRVVDRAPRDELLRRVRRALEAGSDADPRDASLAALLHASKALPKVLPDADRRWLTRRAQALGEGDWASEAVTKAIAEVNSAVLVATMIATAGGASAGTS